MIWDRRTDSGSVQRAPRSQIVVPGGRGPEPPGAVGYEPRPQDATPRSAFGTSPEDGPSDERGCVNTTTIAGRGDQKQPLWLTGPQAGLFFPQAGTHTFLSRPGRNPCDRIATIKCQFGYAERSMSVEWRARSRSLAWSNPLAWWWSLLTAVSAINIAAWFSLYHYLQQPRTGGLSGTSGTELMLLLCAAYVFGCAFRSFLPRADVQRICLFDTWLSSVVIGRSVATVAEVCFAAQWAIALHQLGTMTGA